MNPRVILRGLLVLLSLVAIGYLIKLSPLGQMLDEHWIDREVRGKGLSGEMLFIGIATLATAIGFPRQVIAFLGGYAFGFLDGVLIALLATVLGCVTTLYYARWLGRAMVVRRFPERVRKFDDFLSQQPFGMALLIRLLPVGSNVVTNLIAGVSSIPTRPFVLGSAVGYVPQTAIFALAGSGVSLDPTLRIGLSVLLFVVSGVLGVQLYRRYRHGKSFDASLDEDASPR